MARRCDHCKQKVDVTWPRNVFGTMKRLCASCKSVFDRDPKEKK